MRMRPDAELTEKNSWKVLRLIQPAPLFRDFSCASLSAILRSSQMSSGPAGSAGLQELERPLDIRPMTLAQFLATAAGTPCTVITCGEDDLESEPLFFVCELLKPNGVLAMNHHLARGHGVFDFDLPFDVFDFNKALDLQPGR